MRPTRPAIYGMMAEFSDPEVLVAAAHRAREAGYQSMDAYSPYPVEGLAEAIGFTRNRLPMIVLIGGLCGGIGGFFMQWFASTIHYPLNVGGRPLNSWPAFIPVTFELTILMAAFAAVLGMLALNGLPMPYHPVFHVPNFALASRSRFFLCIQAVDPHFDAEEVRKFLEGQGANEVAEVKF